ncbi:hypothetical protein [Halocynthiibacter namhaensis]|uniref:hypothetical protein n=1 Tax=Halocynthiibacter namhaensis TaxID=1290553 RepID=UPI0012E07198|nr:hypothetical protein [Halocynthiibacter namhaensis]
MRYECFKRHLSENIPQTKVLAMNIKRVVGISASLICTGQLVLAQSCLPPIPPYVPEDNEAIRIYADLVKRDVENYFDDAELYFRCQDQLRREVFEQVRQVGEEYGRVIARSKGEQMRR